MFFHKIKAGNYPIFQKSSQDLLPQRNVSFLAFSKRLKHIQRYMPVIKTAYIINDTKSFSKQNAFIKQRYIDK